MNSWKNPAFSKLFKKEEIKEKESEIIDLSTIMGKSNNENFVEEEIDYVISPIVARYNGSRVENFNTVQMATVANRYLEFTISNGIDQKSIH